MKYPKYRKKAKKILKKSAHSNLSIEELLTLSSSMKRSGFPEVSNKKKKELINNGLDYKEVMNELSNHHEDQNENFENDGIIHTKPVSLLSKDEIKSTLAEGFEKQKNLSKKEKKKRKLEKKMKKSIRFISDESADELEYKELDLQDIISNRIKKNHDDLSKSTKKNIQKTESDDDVIVINENRLQNGHEDAISIDESSSDIEIFDKPSSSRFADEIPKRRKKLDKVDIKKRDNQSNSQSKKESGRYFLSEISDKSSYNEASAQKLLRISEGSRKIWNCMLCTKDYHSVDICSYASCVNCGSIGHIEHDCNESKKIKCTFCNKFGHKEKECPQKKLLLTEDDLINFHDDLTNLTGEFKLTKPSFNTERYCFNCGESGHTGLDCTSNGLREVQIYEYQHLRQTSILPNRRRR